MGIGARSTDQWREHRALLEAISRGKEEPPAAPPPPVAEPVPMPSARREMLGPILLALLGALWVAALVTASEAGDGALVAIAQYVSMASGPLALLGILYLLLQRTSRREARRFGRTASAMRAEAIGLERVIGALSDRIEDNRKALAEQAQELIRQGEDMALRMAELTAGMRGESTALAQHADRLENAAAAARGDMSTLAGDLPHAEAQVRDIAALVRDIGADALRHASTLDGQLAALADRGREAGERTGGQARELAAHLDRIETASENVGARIESVTARMTDAIDGALAGASDAVDHTRQGLEAQSAAMLAMIEQASAALERAGADSAAALEKRLDDVGGRIETIASRLAAQGEASEVLIAALDRSLAEVEQRFAELGTTGAAGTARLSDAITTLRGHAESLTHLFSGSGDAAEALLARAEALRAALEASAKDLDTTLPQALAHIEEQAERGRAAIAASAPEAARLETAITGATAKLREADATLDRQREAFAAVGAAAEAQLAGVRAQAEALEGAIARADAGARSLADGAGPQLIEALLRVRETAALAADHARTTLGAIIPEAAASLESASGAAIEKAVNARIGAQLAGISEAAQRAVAAADQAAARLAQRMEAIEGSASAIDTKFEQARAEAAEQDEEHFARRVALLIESLNSAAIDVTKILSNDVTDSAWTAYLKGDRSVFTRRAVRLVDSGQIREIARHYDEEPEFRDQVNRYIHDFEAMLRRVLASRDGAPLGVTLLSSDMGKLYVALAQAIERLRT